MSLKNLVNNIVEDVAVDLTQAFDRNFERKAFFDRAWKQTNHPNSNGSLLLRSGRLRKSVKAVQGNKSISWSSSLPYASIHNEGGIMIITQKMKSFFWAMYYKNAKAITFNVKKKAMANTQRNRKLTAEANKWKAMALLKVGTKIKVEQRQFIGWHPEVDRRIKKIVDHNLQQIDKEIIKKLKQ